VKRTQRLIVRCSAYKHTRHRVCAISVVRKMNRKSIYWYLRWYGIPGVIRLSFSLLMTRIAFRPARLIRLPVFIRSFSKVRFGREFTSGVGLRIDIFDGGVLRLGDGIQVNDYVHIGVSELVSIGDGTLIGSRVLIIDHNHGRFDESSPGNEPESPPGTRPLHSKQIVIGSNVWIGDGAAVLPGVSIGDGAVIGANAVVVSDVPRRTVAVGNPARVTRVFDDATGEWTRVER